MERLTNAREAAAQRRAYEKRLEQGYPRNIPEERFLRLAAYEDIGLEPEELLSATDMAKVACALHELNAYKDLGTIDRIRELVQADRVAVEMPYKTAWINVKDRLPKDRGNVLVVAFWHERWGVYVGWCAPERAAWYVHVGLGDRSDVAVTHWMPLPELPKEEQDG